MTRCKWQDGTRFYGPEGTADCVAGAWTAESFPACRAVASCGQGSYMATPPTRQTATNCNACPGNTAGSRRQRPPQPFSLPHHRIHLPTASLCHPPGLPASLRQLVSIGLVAEHVLAADNLAHSPKHHTLVTALSCLTPPLSSKHKNQAVRSRSRRTQRHGAARAGVPVLLGNTLIVLVPPGPIGHARPAHQAQSSCQMPNGYTGTSCMRASQSRIVGTGCSASSQCELPHA